ATQIRLDRGYRMVELLKQGQYKPMDVFDQVFSIYAGTRGHLDKIPRNQVHAWEEAFHAFMREQKSELRRKIVETRSLDTDSMAALEQAIGDYKNQFASKHGGSRVA